APGPVWGVKEDVAVIATVVVGWSSVLPVGVETEAVDDRHGDVVVVGVAAVVGPPSTSRLRVPLVRSNGTVVAEARAPQKRHGVHGETPLTGVHLHQWREPYDLLPRSHGDLPGPRRELVQIVEHRLVAIRAQVRAGWAVDDLDPRVSQVRSNEVVV